MIIKTHIDMETAIILSRCSTSEAKQDVTRQEGELLEKYSKQYNIVKSFAYYMSGTKNDEVNSDILEYVRNNNIKHIITSEISRISRKISSAMLFLEVTNQEGINVIVDNFNLHTLNEDKTPNHMTMTLLSIASTMASAELQITKSRLNSGRNKFIAQNGYEALGRKKGVKETKDKFLLKHLDVTKLLNRKISIRNISAITNKSTSTVQRVKRMVEVV